MVFFALRRLRRGPAAAAPADDGEKPPALVDGTSVFAGMHKGVKYWIYYENERARLEIEMGEETAEPFISDRSTAKAEMPGDSRDAEVKELFELRALRVEAAATGALVAALFPERILNSNSGRPGGPCPEEAAVNKVVELLSSIRDKSRKPSGDPEAESPV